MNSFTEVPIQKFKTLIKLKNMDSLLNLGCAIQLLNASGSARVFNTFLSERFTLWKSCCVSCSSKFFFFFGGGVEFRASCLLGRHSTSPSSRNKTEV
jgi:hypothetical protein